MTVQVVLAGSIFIAIYGLIISEKVNRAAAAVFGGALMVLLGVVSESNVIDFIDFGTIGLLIGMMVIVNIMKKTGIFEYMAIRAAQKAKAEPWMIMVLFSIITALASALLDNVTTILLIAPVTFVITETLKINPYPYIIVEVMMANIGGTATLIGDPPNIMIGSANGLGFVDFITNLGPVVAVIIVVTLLIVKFTVGKKLHVTQENKQKIMAMDNTHTIKDRKLLIKSVLILVITVLGFIFHSALHLESATVALSGAAILLFISGLDPEDIFMEIEWTTIFFFISLFVLVGGLQEAGIINMFAEVILNATHGNVFWTVMSLLWASALLSAFLDNIPFVATMIPLIQSMGQISGMDTTPLWWALALGACLGGNGTMIGASANVVACGMLERKNHKVNFFEYMKLAFPLMIVSIVISTIYLGLFYV